MPHPFDRFRSEVITKSGIEDVLPYADIVEVFNSRNSMDADNRAAHDFARRHNLLTSGVSDAHTTIELGRTYVTMPEFDGTPDGFKAALAQGTIHARKTTPLIHVATTRLQRSRDGYSEVHGEYEGVPVCGVRPAR